MGLFNHNSPGRLTRALLALICWIPALLFRLPSPLSSPRYISICFWTLSFLPEQLHGLWSAGGAEIPRGQGTPHTGPACASGLRGLKLPIPTIVACWCLGISVLAFTYFSIKMFTIKDFKHTKAGERGKMNTSLSAPQINKKDVTHTGEVS